MDHYFRGGITHYYLNEEEGYLYSSENNLPTFRLNAPVIIRAKVKRYEQNIIIYSPTLLRIHIIGGQRLERIAPPPVGKFFSEL